MGRARADGKRRVVLPGARPGDVFDVQRLGEARYVLVRLHRPAPLPGVSREQRLEAMSRSPVRMTLSWDQLKQLTREP